MVFEQTSDTSTFKLIFSFDFDFFVFDIFFFRLVELFELFNDIDDRRPDFEISADDRRFVLLIAVPLIFLTDQNFWKILNFTRILESMPIGNFTTRQPPNMQKSIDNIWQHELLEYSSRIEKYGRGVSGPSNTVKPTLDDLV